MIETESLGKTVLRQGQATVAFPWLRLKKLRLFFQNGFEPIVKIVWTMKRFLLQHMSNMTVENCRTCSSVSHFVRLSSLSANMS